MDSLRIAILVVGAKVVVSLLSMLRAMFPVSCEVMVAKVWRMRTGEVEETSERIVVRQ